MRSRASMLGKARSKRRLPWHGIADDSQQEAPACRLRSTATCGLNGCFKTERHPMPSSCEAMFSRNYLRVLCVYKNLPYPLASLSRYRPSCHVVCVWLSFPGSPLCCVLDTEQTGNSEYCFRMKASGAQAIPKLLALSSFSRSASPDLLALHQSILLLIP